MPRPTVAKSKAAAAPAAAKAWAIPTGWMCALIFLLVLVAYFPVLNAGFIWDDSGHITRADLRSLAGLVRIWFEVGATQQYYPVLHSAFWLEQFAFGESAAGYHLITILLHATAACLAGVFLMRLAVPGAWLAAILFAVHPVHVESVAWISEQKNTLSAVFYLWAALRWLKFDQDRRRVDYAWATALFVLALLTKTVTASLPAALLVIAWWKRGRVDWRQDVRPLLPWFGASLAAGLMTVWFERTLIGAQGGTFDLDPVQRALLAGRAIWFYLGKLFWPADLIFIYPRWTVAAGTWWQYLFPLAAIGLLVGLWLKRHRSRGPLAAFLFFAGTLFPALGFVNVFPFTFSYVADHFQYLASLGMIALVAVGLGRSSPRWPAWVARGARGVIILILGILTWRQTHLYRDVVTLYEDTLERNPDSWLAHNNLGTVLVGAGRAADAIPHFERTLQLLPNYAEAESNLGDALTRVGRPADALPHLDRALKLQTNYPEAHSNLGVALIALGKNDEALTHFREAVKLRPDYATAHFNLGLALASSGRPAEAIPEFQTVTRLQPDYAEAELDWAIALTLTSRFAEAVPHFEKAVRLGPANPDTHNKYGRALAENGRLDEGISHYRQAVELAPNFPEAHYNLAVALRQAGRLEEAAEHLNQARRLGWRN